jgi:hypothetical protein
LPDDAAFAAGSQHVKRAELNDSEGVIALLDSDVGQMTRARVLYENQKELRKPTNAAFL